MSFKVYKCECGNEATDWVEGYGYCKRCYYFARKQWLKENQEESGDYANIGSSGDGCVICCIGNTSYVSAKKGSWITLAEWEYDYEKRRYIPVCVKTEFVDGERIKEDVLYRLRNGEFTAKEK